MQCEWQRYLITGYTIRLTQIRITYLAILNTCYRKTVSKLKTLTAGILILSETIKASAEPLSLGNTLKDDQLIS